MSRDLKRELIPDEELDAAFRGTDFGGMDHRTLLEIGVLKKAAGYHCGHTITQIMCKLRLTNAKGAVLKRGKLLLRIAFHDQMINGG